MGRYLSVTPVDQLRRQMGVRFYSTWYYIRPRVGILARKRFGSEFACFVRLSIVFLNVILSRFYVFWTSKSQKIWGEGLRPLSPPPGPCYGSATGLTAARGFQTPSCFALRAFHAHIVWASPVLPTSTFFFSINPCEYSHLKF